MHTKSKSRSYSGYGSASTTESEESKKCYFIGKWMSAPDAGSLPMPSFSQIVVIKR